MTSSDDPAPQRPTVPRQQTPTKPMQAEGRPSPSPHLREIREPDSNGEEEPGYGHGV